MSESGFKKYCKCLARLYARQDRRFRFCEKYGSEEVVSLWMPGKLMVLHSGLHSAITFPQCSGGDNRVLSIKHNTTKRAIKSELTPANHPSEWSSPGHHRLGVRHLSLGGVAGRADQAARGGGASVTLHTVASPSNSQALRLDAK
ncbi:hypothetical protein Pmani_035608 [Petrolisthes manimaculis]|uniref:Uncharacterized protein n=1 Tax=Petrolisthes manimaculis TaxID=1843537 RepID=A0AAE1NM27_9EUCA|nr:hypothetical protein Pmani_035608 [Petrolisthes manimaculis]